MFTIIGLMLTGMLLGYLLRKRSLHKIHTVITVLIWALLFILQKNYWSCVAGAVATSKSSKDCTP